MTLAAHENHSKDITGRLNKPTAISEQDSMMNILPALVFCFFFRSLCSNKAFDVVIANAVNIIYISRIKMSTELP